MGEQVLADDANGDDESSSSPPPPPSLLAEEAAPEMLADTVVSKGDDEPAATAASLATTGGGGGGNSNPSSTQVVENQLMKPQQPIDDETSTDTTKLLQSYQEDHHKETSLTPLCDADNNDDDNMPLLDGDDDDHDVMRSLVKEPEKPTISNTLVSGSETEYDENGEEEEEEEDEDEVKNDLMMELKEEGTVPTDEEIKNKSLMELDVNRSTHAFYMDQQIAEGDESGDDKEQTAFIRQLENFFKERNMEFKPPKFYGECLNCLKLWRAVIRLGGYDQVTTNKLWRQVGQYFKPPKTCTTVSWTFRCFYEKALLDFERHKMHRGEIHVPVSSLTDPISVVSQLGDGQASGSGRARRDAAARAMQGWHSRLLGNDEVGYPVTKDKNSISGSKREKQLKSFGVLKRKKPSNLDYAVKASHNIAKTAKIQLEMTTIIDIGPVADWVKINVRRTRDCFEVYALVPGLLREEVRVQSDPAGRLVISGEPEQPDNPWGVTPFKKVINLPSRIDPHQTSAIVTLHGQLFVRVPFDQSDS